MTKHFVFCENTYVINEECFANRSMLPDSQCLQVWLTCNWHLHFYGTVFFYNIRFVRPKCIRRYADTYNSLYKASISCVHLTSGILDKLKRFLPSYILRKVYFTMVQSRLTYGILAWWFEYQRFVKLQKRLMRIITLSTYNTHREPLWKKSRITDD